MKRVYELERFFVKEDTARAAAVIIAAALFPGFSGHAENIASEVFHPHPS
jgi:hypothetical protein